MGFYMCRQNIRIVKLSLKLNLIIIFNFVARINFAKFFGIHLNSTQHYLSNNIVRSEKILTTKKNCCKIFVTLRQVECSNMDELMCPHC